VEEWLWHESQRLQWLPADETLFEQAPEEPEALMATFRPILSLPARVALPSTRS